MELSDNSSNELAVGKIIPVARRPRGRAVLFGLLRSGTLLPDAVILAEEDTLRRVSRTEAAKLIQELTLFPPGKRNQARRAQRRYLHSIYARLDALFDSLPSRLRDDTSLPFAERDDRRARRLAAVFEALKIVGDFSKPPRVRERPILKPSGDWRTTYSLPWIDQARMRLCDRAFKPFAGFHPSQHAIHAERERRGRTSACEAVLRNMENCGPNHGLLTIDVRDFFGSINRSWLEANIDLPVEVHSYVLYGAGYTNVGLPPLSGQPGLIQGSAASPRIAEWVMAQVLRSFDARLPGFALTCYSDNLAVVCTRAEGAAIEELIREVFQTSEAGPFRVRVQWKAFSEGPEYLGYNFTHCDGDPVAILSHRRVEGIFHKLDERLAGRDFDEAAVAAHIHGLCEAHKLFPMADRLREAMLHDLALAVRTRDFISVHGAEGLADELLRRVSRARPDLLPDQQTALAMEIVTRPLWKTWARLASNDWAGSPSAS